MVIRNSRFQAVALLLSNLLIAAIIPGRAAIDPTTVPITAEKVQVDARIWPLPFWRAANDIRRAAGSRLAKYAYEIYGRVVTRHPQDNAARILYGLAAIHYHINLVDPGVGGGAFSKDIAQAEKATDEVAHTSLEAALDGDKTGAAHAFLGHYLANSCETKPEPERGIALLREAIHIDPKIASYHASLALALSNSQRPTFNRAEAEREARLALRLEPDIAAAHWTLFLMYDEFNERKAAIAELKAYAAVLPKGAVEQSPSLPLYCRQLGISLADLTDHTETTDKH